MSTYKQFEELPAWNAATDLAVAVFKLTEAQSFRFKGDLVNQLRRAALSVANNIAEGFERGTTAELISFLYIARGSAGEVRSMLRFALRLGEMPAERERIEALIPSCESVSRQLRGWLDSLQNSDIQGQRHLNDRTRALYEDNKRVESFVAQMAAFRARMEEGLRNGTWGKPDSPPVPSPFSKDEQTDATPSRPASQISDLKSVGSPSSFPPSPATAPAAPPCPQCGRPMVRRTSRDGTPFWGCSGYPQCKGYRRI